jgi:NAD(H)-dependent 7beta-hydroxy-3-oxo-delta4-cholenoic acid oxidoreductase
MKVRMKLLEKLFSPIQIGRMELRNRIVMSPMATNWASDDGSIPQKLKDYYETRAKGGVGLIILESTAIDRLYPYLQHTVGLWDDELIPSFRELVKTIHAHGAMVAPQIIHPGPESTSFLKGIQPVGPSPILCKTTKQLCRELTSDEIKSIIEQFGEAARRARKAGCDGIELDAAHSYKLMGSFLSPLRNKRIDSYGGSIEGRLKFTLEVIKSIRDKAGRDFPIILRISGDELIPGGRNLQETQYIAPILAQAGVDAFDISGGVVTELFSRVVPPIGTPLGLNAAFSAAVKQVVDVPVIVVGRINDPRLAENMLERQQADLVAMGRALIADPELPKKAAEGRFEDIAPCTGCGLGCIGALNVGKPMTCLINPAVGREKEMAITPAAKPKNVLVAGGGPAGLEAARVAALRGHQVTLFEKEAKLGGQFNLAAVPPLKQELCQVLKYLCTQVEKAGTRVVLNTEVTQELIEELRPDVVIVATGGQPLIPAIPGVDRKKVATAHDVLAGKAAVRSRNVIVIGGGMVGCEAADFLADLGDNPPLSPTSVTIVEMLPHIGLDTPVPQMSLRIQRLREKGVKVVTRAKLREILDDGVVYVKDGQEEVVHGMGHIILAMGTRSVNAISDKIRGRVTEVYVIGDAKEPRMALEAIAEGAEVGRKI